jgi:tripartite-type tricarboxylate transporter receptor subunit TctC
LIREAFFMISILAAVALLAAVCAQAQTYPVKPIRLVVPVVPGGIVDVVGRLLAQKMTEQSGQNTIVDNRPGGLTNVGSEFVARSPGDGYTLLLQSLPMVVNPVVLGKMPYDYEKDLAPVSLIVTSPYLWVVHPSVPVRIDYVAWVEASAPFTAAMDVKLYGERRALSRYRQRVHAVLDARAAGGRICREVVDIVTLVIERAMGVE